MFGIAQDVEVVIVKSLSFNEEELKRTLRSLSFKKRTSEFMPSPAPSPTPKEMAKKPDLERSFSFKNWEMESAEPQIPAPSRTNALEMGHLEIRSPGRSTGQAAVLPPQPASGAFEFSSPRPKSELDAAAVKLQKVYKSYRTRRNLADCAVVVEELWWKALDFASLKRSSISFFEHQKPETAVSKWARAMTRVAKVGKGLSKDEKAQKLALRHWLEAIDPRHRYGHNLHIYYDLWFESESTQPFFYWLDVGDGKDVNLEKCPRSKLQRQIIEYLGMKEREAYEIIVEEGKLVYKQSQELVDTVEGSKWIFVLSTSRNLYVGQKKKGKFQHSSFLAGGATSAAGRLVAQQGVLKAIWPYSGHYLPTQENFKEFVSFLADHDVDLADVKKCSVDDDEFPSSRMDEQETAVVVAAAEDAAAKAEEPPIKQPFELAKRLSRKWSTGAGPRIGCVRDYPVDLQIRALEHVNLSPRVVPSPAASRCPIPSPRPSPRVRLSPGLQYMGFPSPRVAPSMALPSPRVAPAMGFPSPKVSLTLPKPKQG